MSEINEISGAVRVRVELQQIAHRVIHEFAQHQDLMKDIVRREVERECTPDKVEAIVQEEVKRQMRDTLRSMVAEAIKEEDSKFAEKMREVMGCGE